MNSPFRSTASLKLGLKQTVQGPLSDGLQPLLHKLSPLPVYRRKLLNPSRTRESLASKGYKFFAKLPAAGPQTLQILQDIKKSRCIKLIQYFEFDPYLCDCSHINDLKGVCHKIKNIKRLNLVIRRVDNKVELGDLGPFIARFTRLIAIRVEFPSTQNITEDALAKFHIGIGNCVFLKSLEAIDVNMPERSRSFNKISANAFSKQKWVENVKSYISFKKGTIKNEFDKDPKPPRKQRSSRIKNFAITISLPGKWASGEEKEFDQQMKSQMLLAIPKMQRMKVKLIRVPPKYEDIANVFTAFSILPELRVLEIEYLNCHLKDLDMVAYVQGLPKMKQLDYFSLKVLQNPNISEECIARFAEVASKFNDIPSFDFYFRKLSLPPRGILELGKRIQSLPNIQCSCGKESIHIFKKKNTE